jgi:hypothetical protein
MRYKAGLALVLVTLVLAATSPAVAHHAVQAAFDQDKQATLTGTLSKVMWINPTCGGSWT